MHTRERNSSLWILGHGGFFGSALASEATAQGYSVFPRTLLPWSDPEARSLAFHSIAEEFAGFSHSNDTTIIWAAGAQGVANSQTGSSPELDSFQNFVGTLMSIRALHGATVVIVSSAGGVYGGSPAPPFDSSSPVRAINQYGLNKIAIEELAVGRLTEHFHVQIARVTNLYGPWHGPRQGLINRLCTAAATREALQIYVPLDTVRDYIYVTDAARLLLLELETKSTAVDTHRSRLVLIGSGESSSVGSVINTVANVTHRKVPVTMAQLMETDLQPRDLRMRPSWVDHGLDFEPLTLTQGIKRLFDALVTVPRWSETDK